MAIVTPPTGMTCPLGVLLWLLRAKGRARARAESAGDVAVMSRREDLVNPRGTWYAPHLLVYLSSGSCVRRARKSDSAEHREEA